MKNIFNHQMPAVPQKQSASNAVRRRALLLAAFLLLVFLLSIGAYLLQKRQAQQKSRPIAYIYSNGVLLQRIDLSAVKEPYTFSVVSKNGGENQIEVRPGSIGILSASCPDKLCVHQGFLSAPLFPLICLPNQLTIEIKADSEPDAVAY